MLFNLSGSWTQIVFTSAIIPISPILVRQRISPMLTFDNHLVCGSNRKYFTRIGTWTDKILSSCVCIIQLNVKPLGKGTVLCRHIWASGQKVNMDIDEAYHFLGNWGRYQILAYILLTITCTWLPAWQIMSLVFTPDKPPFHCKVGAVKINEVAAETVV